MEREDRFGLLVAAKSILRFGEVNWSHRRKMPEYIIIGAFMRFGGALLIACLTQQVVTYWKLP